MREKCCKGRDSKQKRGWRRGKKKLRKSERKTNNLIADAEEWWRNMRDCRISATKYCRNDRCFMKECTK